MISLLTRAVVSRSLLKTGSSKVIQCGLAPFVLKYSTENSTQNSTENAEKPKRASLRLRRQQLKPFPLIECVLDLELSTFVKSNFKMVKYGDHEFKESLDGYVHVYVSGAEKTQNNQTLAAYSVYYGRDHLLNDAGVHRGRPSLKSAYLSGVLQAIKSIPKSSFTKVCLCVPDTSLISFVTHALRNMSENSFRSVRTGKLNKDLEINMELNTEIRMRNDLTFRMKYVPNDISVMDMFHCERISERVAMDRLKTRKLINDDEEGFYD